MATSNICWGIEIGAYAVKAIKLEAADNGVNVLDYAIIPHAKVLSTPGIDQNDAIRVTLGTLVAQWDLSKAAIAISVPGQASLARFAKLPPVEPKKVPDIVKFEAAQQIPFPLDQVEWDYQTFVSPDSPDIEVGIFAITRERIMDRLLLLQDVGITPDHVTLSPIAAYNALAYDKGFTEKTPGTVILDIGTTSTDVVIADSGRVWVRTVPLGGHHFTEALVNAFKLSYPKAEKLKKEVESGANSKHIAQAMRPVFSDLAQEVQRSIGYYQSLHKEAKLTRLIGIGSTFLMPGIRKFLKQQLSASIGPIDVTRIEEYDRLRYTGLGDERRAEELRNNALSLATCYGLSLQGLAMNTVNANLMPVAIIRKSVWRGKGKWFGMAAGLAVAASAAMFIRPVQDNFAVVGASIDPVIERAISDASDLKSSASEAGVIGGASVDNRPVNMISLLDNKSIHAFLLDDLSLMIEDAQKKVPAAPPPAATDTDPAADQGPTPAYIIKSFNTSYRLGEIDVESEFGGANKSSRASSRGGHGAPPPEEQAAAAADPASAKRIVDCELVITTTQPEPQRFMLATIDRWLKNNKVRPNVPYTIVVDESPWSMREEASTASTPGSSRGNRSPERGPGGHGAGGHGGGGDDAETPEQAIRRQRERLANDPTIRVYGGPDTSAGGGGPGGPLPSFNNLKPKDKPGATRATFTVHWHVEINEPPKPGEGSGETADASKGGGA